MKKPKRISSRYIGLIPDYLKSDAYDEHQANYSARRLSLEIYERQTIHQEIKKFKQFCRHPETDNREFFPGMALSILFKNHEDFLASKGLELTIIKKIEIEQNYYMEKLEKIAKSFIQIKSLDELQLINKKHNDNRPYIRPIFNKDPKLQKRYDLSYNEFRELLMSKHRQFLFSANLDFSDATIIQELKKHLQFLRKREKYKPIFNKPKEFITKIKHYKIIQLMDLQLWAQLNDHTLEKNMLDQLLYPNGGFANDRLTETILPLSKALFDFKSSDSQYLIYLADCEFQQKVGNLIA